MATSIANKIAERRVKRQQAFDRFYPAISNTDTDAFLDNFTATLWELMIRADHNNDQRQESRVVNLIGRLRRLTGDGLLQYDSDQRLLYGALKIAALWLRDKGRTLDLSSSDGRYWISRRDGKPRWE